MGLEVPVADIDGTTAGKEGAGGGALSDALVSVGTLFVCFFVRRRLRLLSSHVSCTTRNKTLLECVGFSFFVLFFIVTKCLPFLLFVVGIAVL